MSVGTQSYVPVSGTVTVGGAQNALITNPTAAVANTEYSLALQTNLKAILIRNRDKSADIKFTFVSGESGTKYVTIRPSTVFFVDGLEFSGKTLYYQSSKISTIEVVEYY